eukprot:1161003-Pelagomonas_calceolata.AAC.1
MAHQPTKPLWRARQCPSHYFRMYIPLSTATERHKGYKGVGLQGGYKGVTREKRPQSRRLTASLGLQGGWPTARESG